MDTGIGSMSMMPVLQQQQPPISCAVTFTDPDHPSSLKIFFNKARVSEKYSDVILHVQSKKFYAHKLVLAAASPYFDSIFQTRAVTKKASNSVKVENIIISSTQETDIFATFLNYLYTGEVTVDKGNVGEIMRLANHFLVTKLRDFCGEFLVKYIDPENCLQIKDIADKFGMPGLSKSATIFVQNRLQDVSCHIMCLLIHTQSLTVL